MHTRRIGVAGLLLGLGLLVSGLAAQSAAAFPASARAALLAYAQGPGAGLDAGPAFRSVTTAALAPAQDATNTDDDQDEGGANDTAEGNNNQDDDNETGDDEAVDGVDCVQEGEHEGENEGDC